MSFCQLNRWPTGTQRHDKPHVTVERHHGESGRDRGNLYARHSPRAPVARPAAGLAGRELVGAAEFIIVISSEPSPPSGASPPARRACIMLLKPGSSGGRPRAGRGHQPADGRPGSPPQQRPQAVANDIRRAAGSTSAPSGALRSSKLRKPVRRRQGRRQAGDAAGTGGRGTQVQGVSIPNIPSAVCGATSEGLSWLGGPIGSHGEWSGSPPAQGVFGMSAWLTCEPRSSGRHRRSEQRVASRCAGVPMMQSAHLRNRDHRSFGGMLDSARNRCVPFQRQMSAGFVVVHEVAR